MQGPPQTRIDLPAVSAFLLISFGGAWLVCSPVWLSGRGLATPGTFALLLVMMFTPTAATWVVTHWIRRPAALGLETGLIPSIGWRATRRTVITTWLATPALLLVALALATALGLYHPDLMHLSGLAAAARGATGKPLPAAIPTPVLALVLIAEMLLAPIVNSIFTFGEEWGWRGWLLPQLLPLGRWPALITSGVIWGLWHAPIILLGYNYPTQPRALGMLLMTVMTVLLGSILGWLRLRTTSIWPAVVVHAGVNGGAGLALALSQADTATDSAVVGVTGWTGWLVMLTVLAGLVAADRRRPTPPETSTLRPN
jgi:membrane protease YdiL (CAAX protease family)